MSSPKKSNQNLVETESITIKTVEVEVERYTGQIKQISKVVGPGVVTGASDDDPSGIGTYSAIGAQYGLGLNWLTLFSFPLMITMQEIAGRIGIVTGHGLAGVIKRTSRPWILKSLVILFLIANTINIGADLGAMAAATQLISPFSFYLLTIIFALIIIGLEVFVSYKRYANILKWLTLSLLAYFATALIVTDNWQDVIKTLFTPSFSFDKDYLLIIVGFLGTTISPYLYFWQTSEEVEERNGKMVDDSPKALQMMRYDVFLGTFLSQASTFFIIVTTALTLHAGGIFQITDAASAASALKPFAGDFAGILFALGIVGTGLLGIPVLAGSSAYAVAETLDWKEGLNLKFKKARGFYITIILSTLIGLAINFVGINPMKALLYAAVVNGVVAVPLIAFMMLIASNKKIMGKHTSGPVSFILGWLTFVVMLVCVGLLAWGFVA